MQICDITRSDEVVGQVTIQVQDFGSTNDEKGEILEVGKRALDAFRNQDWQALHALTPAALRKKDPKRSEAARKAGQTRAANRAKGTPETAPAAPSGPSSTGGGAGTPQPDEDF